MLGKAGSQPTSEPTSSTGTSPGANGSGSNDGNFLQEEGNRIALGVGIGLGLPALILTALGVKYMRDHQR
jgi:hypothetical protein